MREGKEGGGNERLNLSGKRQRIEVHREEIKSER